MKQFFLIVVAMTGLVSSLKPCGPQPNKWVSPINLQGPHYAPLFKPLHVFSFLDGGEGLVLENTGSTVRIQYPIRYNIHSTPANLTDVQISKGPLVDTYTADHLEFRWGPATLPEPPPPSSSSTGSAGSTGGSNSTGSTSTGPFFLDLGEMVQAAPTEYGSDHGFSGHYFPLEMQVYFYNVKFKSYDEALAASPEDPNLNEINEDVVALSVLFEIGTQNEELTKITDRLELIRINHTETSIVAKMCFEKILEAGRDFITYSGSLTQEPCTRGVRWIVLAVPLTVSQAQLDQFRNLTLDSPLWVPPLDQDLFGRVVETNLRQLPLDDKFIPAFHPHGPPVNVIHPEVGGTIINPLAKDANDINFKNYWSPYDYTLPEDDGVALVGGSSSVAATSTGGAAEASTAPAASSVSEAPTAPTAGPPTAGTSGGAASTGPFLIEQGSSAPPVGSDSSTASVVPPPTGGTGGVGGTGGTAAAGESSTNQPQTQDETKVHIPHIFSLSGVPMYTPDFNPPAHNIWEENHYHPKSLNDIPADEQLPAGFKRKISKLQEQVRRQQAMNPLHEDAAPKQQKSTVYTRHWK